MRYQTVLGKILDANVFHTVRPTSWDAILWPSRIGLPWVRKGPTTVYGQMYWETNQSGMHQPNSLISASNRSSWHIRDTGRRDSS
jgi:hypothetical protein